MADIFFSYSSLDRDRVQRVRDLLEADGFSVFWDQATPAGTDWDTWIRQNLSAAKCALVFWSATSVGSPNVRHEATVARDRGKLIPVMLEPLSTEMYPMGLYNVQGANLATWTGDPNDGEWIKLRSEVEAKLTPLWVQRRIHELEAELTAERARRQATESRDSSLQARIAKDAEAEVQFRQELQIARDREQIATEAATAENQRRIDLEGQLAKLQKRGVQLEASATLPADKMSSREAAKTLYDFATAETDAKGDLRIPVTPNSQFIRWLKFFKVPLSLLATAVLATEFLPASSELAPLSILLIAAGWTGSAHLSSPPQFHPILHHGTGAFFVLTMVFGSVLAFALVSKQF